jgi:hypothetical protein
MKSKRFFVSVFSILMTVSQCAKAEWTLIAKFNDGTAFANLQTVKTKNGLKIVETLFNSNRVAFLEDPREPYKSFYTLDAIDCKTNEFAAMKIKYFSEKNGQGVLVASHEDNELLFTEFVKVRPNQPMAQLKKLVCK